MAACPADKISVIHPQTTGDHSRITLWSHIHQPKTAFRNGPHPSVNVTGVGRRSTCARQGFLQVNLALDSWLDCIPPANSWILERVRWRLRLWFYSMSACNRSCFETLSHLRKTGCYTISTPRSPQSLWDRIPPGGCRAVTPGPFVVLYRLHGRQW